MHQPYYVKIIGSRFILKGNDFLIDARREPEPSLFRRLLGNSGIYQCKVNHLLYTIDFRDLNKIVVHQENQNDRFFLFDGGRNGICGDGYEIKALMDLSFKNDKGCWYDDNLIFTSENLRLCYLLGGFKKDIFYHMTRMFSFNGYFTSQFDLLRDFPILLYSILQIDYDSPGLGA